MSVGSEPGGQGNFGLAWLLLCLAFCAHVADEALTGFLGVYNPTVLAMRSQYQWFPMPSFEFRDWLTMLIVANIVLLLAGSIYLFGRLRASRRSQSQAATS